MREQKKLEKYLMNEENLSWEKYLERFTGTVPIEIWSSIGLCGDKYQPETVESTMEIWHINNMSELKRLDNYKIVMEFKKKITREEVEKLPLIKISDWIDFLLREDIVEELLKICPDDFQPLKVTLISKNKHVEPFELHNYYAINVLKAIYALDEEASGVVWDKYNNKKKRRIIYKTNPWKEGGWRSYGDLTAEEQKEAGRDWYPIYHHKKLEKECRIAIDALTGGIVWHPEVAKLLPIHSRYRFITGKEQSEQYFASGELR